MKKNDPDNLKRPPAEPFRPGCKVWLEKGETNFGDGLYYLLLNVHDYGSIAQAAKRMGMSYRAAWGKIKRAEKSWGVLLVETQVGGDLGGGATLTPEGNKLVKCFGEFREKVERVCQETFDECFGNGP
ncbi:winged helix-turn-helix domain-containing protein [Desulfotomaculum sp. 1211_IL3151]|uniref:winged helix-turn-helix domain-containing protein n=1 Tax=Desulfotomaculum sp. 1211_IL3151 TaxID=3084055 RepID=UPI002FDA9D18